MIFKKQWFLTMMLFILVGAYLPAPYSVEAAENTNTAVMQTEDLMLFCSR